MRLLIDAVGIRSGGGVTILTELTHWLPRVRAWDIEVFLLPHSMRHFCDPPAHGGLKVAYCQHGDSGPGRLWWLHRELPEWITKLCPDVVLCLANLGHPQPRWPQVVYLQQAKIFESGLDLDGRCSDILRNRVVSWWIVRGLKASSGVIVQTEAMRQKLVKAIPQLNGRVFHVPVGAPTWPEGGPLRSQVKGAIDACTRPRLFYPAYPLPHKNHRMLIRAMRRIVASHPSAMLLLTLPDSARPSGRYAHALAGIHQTASDCGVQKNIAFLGYLERAEVCYAIKASDVLVFPSLIESNPLPLTEALSLKCLVAASDVDFAREILGPAGAYFDARDPDSIADCVLGVLDPVERGRLRDLLARRRQLVPSWRDVAERLAQILEWAASTRHKEKAPERERIEKCGFLSSRR